MFERLTLISKFNYSWFLMSNFYSEIQRKSEIIIFGTWIKKIFEFLKIKLKFEVKILAIHEVLNYVE